MNNINYSDKQNMIDLGGGVKRKIMSYCDALMAVEVHFEEGAAGQLHKHPHSQITYVLEGEFEFYEDGSTFRIKKGDSVCLKENGTHGCKCLTKGVLLDVFSPMREDFV